MLNAPSPARVRATIAFLIDYLDSIEPDPDLEDGFDDEPYLAGDSWFATAGALDTELDEADLEPWLGWTGAIVQGGARFYGGSEDAEWDPAEHGIGDDDGLAEVLGRAR